MERQVTGLSTPFLFVMCERWVVAQRKGKGDKGGKKGMGREKMDGEGKGGWRGKKGDGEGKRGMGRVWYN